MKANEDFIATYRGDQGLTTTISSELLMVGDIIKVEGGMKVPADCILIDGTDISCDESAMTGEPDNVDKEAVTDETIQSGPNPFMLAKTLIISGQGIAMVGAVGTNTQTGQAEEKLTIEDEATPLQMKLETIANEIGKIGCYVAILTFIANSVNLVIRTMSTDLEVFSFVTLDELVSYLIISISLIIAAVPEGLPLAVTISLAFSVMQMKKENNLVRQLSASETMGGAHEICTDKTGTLTLN
jgi:magnesium-transporting ATPase (P-type)